VSSRCRRQNSTYPFIPAETRAVLIGGGCDASGHGSCQDLSCYVFGVAAVHLLTCPFIPAETREVLIRGCFDASGHVHARTFHVT
jgi:hypothetical protein